MNILCRELSNDGVMNVLNDLLNPLVAHMSPARIQNYKKTHLTHHREVMIVFSQSIPISPCQYAKFCTETRFQPVTTILIVDLMVAVGLFSRQWFPFLLLLKL
jgi:fatty acid desaturase